MRSQNVFDDDEDSDTNNSNHKKCVFYFIEINHYLSSAALEDEAYFSRPGLCKTYVRKTSLEDNYLRRKNKVDIITKLVL